MLTLAAVVGSFGPWMVLLGACGWRKARSSR